MYTFCIKFCLYLTNHVTSFHRMPRLRVATVTVWGRGICLIGKVIKVLRYALYANMYSMLPGLPDVWQSIKVSGRQRGFAPPPPGKVSPGSHMALSV